VSPKYLRGPGQSPEKTPEHKDHHMASYDVIIIGSAPAAMVLAPFACAQLGLTKTACRPRARHAVAATFLNVGASAKACCHASHSLHEARCITSGQMGLTGANAEGRLEARCLAYKDDVIAEHQGNRVLFKKKQSQIG